MPLLSMAITIFFLELAVSILMSFGIIKVDHVIQPNRTEGLYEYDADLGWKLKPLYNNMHIYTQESNAINETINADGWRDYSYTKKKPKDVYRIGIIGCSRTYGYGVDFDETYPKYLETILNKSSDKKFEVMNFGVNGYGLDQLTLNYSKNARNYGPDLVILQLYSPAILRTHYTQMWKTNKPAFSMINEKLTLINHPVPENKTGRIRGWLLNKSSLFLCLEETSLKINNTHKTKFNKTLSSQTELHNLSTAILKHLKVAVENDGKRLVVFVWNKDTWIKEIVQNSGVEVFDLKEYADIKAWEKKGALENPPPVGHWSPLGHQFVAEAIYNYLFKKELIKK